MSVVLHPMLVNFSDISYFLILNSEESASTFCTEVGLVPTDQGNPVCPKCGGPTKPFKSKGKFKWSFVCRARGRTKCCGIINPTENTIFFQTKMTISEILYIIFGFVDEKSTTKLREHLRYWQSANGLAKPSAQSVINFFKRFVEVSEIIVSHNSKQLGGPGKTVRVVKTFWMSIKSKSFQETNQNLLWVFCKEDREGIYFLANSDSEKKLLPLIKQICHPHTKNVYFDKLMQERDEQLKVNWKNPEKTRVVLKSHRKNPLSIHTIAKKRKSMLMHYYKRTRFCRLPYGEKVAIYLQDIIAVYPGYHTKGLTMKVLDPLEPEREGNEAIMPQKRICLDTASSDIIVCRNITDNSISTDFSDITVSSFLDIAAEEVC